MAECVRFHTEKPKPTISIWKNFYDETKPSSYINYLDANNLYGLAMCQKLPYKDIRWIQRQFTEDDIKNYSDLSTGYILNVDLVKNYRDKSLHQLTKGTFALHGCRLVHSRFVRVDREHVDLSGGAMLIFSVLPTGPPEQRCLAALITISLLKLYMPDEIYKAYIRIKLAVLFCA